MSKNSVAPLLTQVANGHSFAPPYTHEEQFMGNDKWPLYHHTVSQNVIYTDSARITQPLQQTTRNKSSIHKHALWDEYSLSILAHNYTSGQ